MDLADVVSRARQVVLYELSTLHHRDLGDAAAHADAHEVSADWLPAAFATTTTPEGVLVQLHRSIVGYGLHRLVALPLAASLVLSALAGGPALATTAGAATTAPPAAAFTSTTRSGLVLTAIAIRCRTAVTRLRGRSAIAYLRLPGALR